MTECVASGVPRWHGCKAEWKQMVYRSFHKKLYIALSHSLSLSRSLLLHIYIYIHIYHYSSIGISFHSLLGPILDSVSTQFWALLRNRSGPSFPVCSDSVLDYILYIPKCAIMGPWVKEGLMEGRGRPMVGRKSPRFRAVHGLRDKMLGLQRACQVWKRFKFSTSTPRLRQ